MNIQTLASRLVVVVAASGASLFAVGATPGSDSQKQQQPSHQGMMGQGMMSGDMTQMMRSCQSMMGGTSAMALPKLPPGNEKLEAQMHAEMMQKIGEIAGRYAERAK